MTRLMWCLGAAAGVFALFASSGLASAQAPIVVGQVPRESEAALLVSARDAAADNVVEELRGRGCSVETIAVIEAGAWRIYVAGAPEAVGASFPPLRANGAFYVRCRAGVEAPSGVVTGTVGYRERIALPPDAVLTVRLLDVSRADAPAVELAAHQAVLAGGPPYAFSLTYDRQHVQATHTYSVRAEIRVGRELWFTTDTAVHVITQGSPQSVELTLVRGVRALGTAGERS